MNNTNAIQYLVSPKDTGMIETPLPFSLATQADNLIFVSGQASVDSAGQILGSGALLVMFLLEKGIIMKVIPNHGGGANVDTIIAALPGLRCHPSAGCQ